ncbi:unnamed protein product [Caenorhabditis auriculariae]|uniref:Phosphoglycerate mutase family protein n=1 Tax=Caenorhabditis auriculariae TaxID=2777116 RepID=A0A8S1HT05_9PELO|nr:unnamed protein product [Caenorhabditis auriculariae]
MSAPSKKRPHTWKGSLGFSNRGYCQFRSGYDARAFRARHVIRRDWKLSDMSALSFLSPFNSPLGTEELCGLPSSVHRVVVLVRHAEMQMPPSDKPSVSKRKGKTEKKLPSARSPVPQLSSPTAERAGALVTRQLIALPAKFKHIVCAPQLEAIQIAIAVNKSLIEKSEKSQVVVEQHLAEPSSGSHRFPNFKQLSKMEVISGQKLLHPGPEKVEEAVKRIETIFEKITARYSGNLVIFCGPNCLEILTEVITKKKTLRMQSKAFQAFVFYKKEKESAWERAEKP